MLRGFNAARSQTCWTILSLIGSHNFSYSVAIVVITASVVILNPAVIDDLPSELPARSRPPTAGC